jgi:hypothetical protein
MLGSLAAGSASAADDAAMADAERDYDYVSFTEDLFTEQHRKSDSVTKQRPTPVDPKSPLTIWTGPNNSFLKGTLKVESAVYGNSNAWFGEAKENIGGNPDNWWETGAVPGIEGSYFTKSAGEIFGRIDMVSQTSTNLDGAGSNLFFNDEGSKTLLNDAYLGWRSGDLFSSLGQDFLDIRLGKQAYNVGDGFILHTQSSNGKDRGGFWLGQNSSSEFTALVRTKTGAFQGDLVYFKPNDNVCIEDDCSRSGTDLTGVTLDYDFDKAGSLGGGFYTLSSDDNELRDGMDVYDLRYEVKPFAAFDGPAAWQPLAFKAEYVYEKNDSKLEASGYYASASYNWEGVKWTPTVSYRYAGFEGDKSDTTKSENFDSLYYGFSDWGTWYQGEIIGEYVLDNSNLNTHMVSLNVKPTKSVSINLFYYKFLVDRKESFGVTSNDFADEVDLAIDLIPNDNLWFSFVLAWAKPDDAAKEYTGGKDDWVYGMFWAHFSI